ncbi:MAG: GDP-mannose 4,6-dehydratase [Chloroflexales bacterium]|jgi:GDP-4-dehydro-6-deoxy-D-mannose reductase
MRALITGINGFVGSHLAEYLLQQGDYEIWGVSRSPFIDLISLRDHVRLVQADLSDPEATARAIIAAQPHVIFHLAGQPFVPESFRDPAATLATNTLGALNIFLTMIAQHLPARVLLVGTYEEYGKILPEDLPINEYAPLRPTNPYGVSKVAQGILGLQYHLSHGLDIVRVRPFTHIGPRQNERFVTAAFARQIARIERGLQPPVMQVGNLSACRDFTDVRDVVRAYTLLMSHGVAGEVYNLGTGHAVMIRDILDMLLAESTTPIEVHLSADLMRPIDIPLVTCDARKLRTCTGWAPSMTIRQTMNDILAYWRGATTV